MTQMYTARDRARDDERPAPFNGLALLAGVQVDADDVTRGFIVLLDRNVPQLPERYVTGWVRTLTDPEWADGNYHADYLRAVGDVALRVAASHT